LQQKPKLLSAKLTEWKRAKPQSAAFFWPCSLTILSKLQWDQDCNFKNTRCKLSENLNLWRISQLRCKHYLSETYKKSWQEFRAFSTIENLPLFIRDKRLRAAKCVARTYLTIHLVMCVQQ
jgi:hypothetical protein